MTTTPPTTPPPRTFHSYEPRNGHGLPHDPFNAIVGPRPIGWISTQSATGATNLAPYSFFNAFNYVPPIVGFASIGYKDTVRNVQETGEFVWNLATRDLAEAMNQSCANAPPEVSEFTLAGLTRASSSPSAGSVLSMRRASICANSSGRMPGEAVAAAPGAGSTGADAAVAGFRPRLA